MRKKIKFHCDFCGCGLSASAADAERLTDCPHCGRENTIPPYSEHGYGNLEKNVSNRYEVSETWESLKGIALVILVSVAIFAVSLPVIKGVKYLIGDVDFSAAADSAPSQPSATSSPNIVAVKESSSNPTVGIIGGPNAKPRYLLVPSRKSYEVTYEDDGVLKTKTMSHDPTK